MPRISVFYGIVVTMYSSDHAPPHFHARYGEYEAQIAIDTGEPLAGGLPIRAFESGHPHWPRRGRFNWPHPPSAFVCS
jgi:hypothetical protein